MLFLALANVFVIVGITFYIAAGVLTVRRLGEVSSDSEEISDPPLVSIIVPAKNEEAAVADAVKSLFEQDYPNFEIILINDRSTDATGEVLQRIVGSQPNASLIHVQELPEGWLGKNHALHVGVQRAAGEYLLFADADVVMDRTMLRRAMQVVLRDELDHFTCGFQANMPSSFLCCMVALFTVCFALFFRPWKARDPRSKAYIGIGGFNLIRRSAYDAVKGHESIAMRPDDDVKLGKILKEAGFRQEFLDAANFVSVPWYSTFAEMTVGLEKNTFAIFQYRLSWMLICSFTLLLVPGWPMVAVWFAHGAVQWAYLAAIGTTVLLMLLIAKGLRFSAWCVLWLPLVLPMFTWVVWRAAWLTYRQGGIRWRGTLYRLDELRRNTV